jgi:hypothetical protein
MPPHAPTKALSIITIISKIFGEVNVSIIRGAIFCQDKSRAEFIQDSLFIVGGSQKCKGAAPSFSNIAVDRMVFVICL